MSTNPTRTRLWELWQVPTFFLGVLALLGACLGHPLWRQGQARCLDRRLALAAQTLENPDATAADVLEEVESVVASADHYPRHAGRAHLLVGVTYLRQAEKASPSDVAEVYGKARTHLEQSERLGVPEGDRARLAYALARAWHHTGEPPARVGAALEEAAPRLPPADAAGAYALLTQVHMRTPTPNLKAALEANKKLLDLPMVDEDILAPARLLRGELLLALQSPAEAREALKYLKHPAPAPLVRKARFIEARTYQEEEQWARAAKNWRELLDDQGDADTPEQRAERGRFLYNLGVCCRHLEQPEEAARAWQKAMELGGVPEAAVAALALAELRLLGPAPQSAMEAFGRVVRDVPKPEAWPAAPAELHRAREAFERGCQIYHHVTRDYEQSMQLARLYTRIAPPGVAPELYAQAAESAAKVKREQACKAKTAVQVRLEEDAARGLYREAARAYEDAAREMTTVDQGERLWKSADCWLQAQDPTAAIPALERFVKVGRPAEKLGEVWFLLGEARRAAGKESEAIAAYVECIRLKQSGPHACRARYQIALYKITRGAWDEAQDELEANRTLLHKHPDPEALESSLYELGSLLFRRRNYQIAYLRLDEALTSFPNSPRALTARFHLAECYRFLAAQESQNIRLPEKTSPDLLAHYQQQYRIWLGKAAKGYEELTEVLLARSSSKPLSSEDAAILRHASFAAAESRSNLGQYNDAIRLYEALLKRYDRRYEMLDALYGIATCYWRQGSMPQGKQTVELIRKALRELDDSAFTQPTSLWSRQEWEKWLAEVSK